MKNLDEATRVYAPGTYLAELTAIDPETDIADEFLGWDLQTGQPIYGCYEIVFNPTYHVSIAIDKWTSETGMKLKASLALAKEGVKNRIKEFDFAFKPYCEGEF